MAFVWQWPMRVNLRNADAFVPEGPDDGSQAWNAWNVPSRSPSRRVRYDRLVRGGFRLACWTNPGATDQTVPYGTDQVWPLPGISCLATLVSSLRDKLSSLGVTPTIRRQESGAARVSELGDMATRATGAVVGSRSDRANLNRSPLHVLAEPARV